MARQIIRSKRFQIVPVEVSEVCCENHVGTPLTVCGCSPRDLVYAPSGRNARRALGRRRKRRKIPAGPCGDCGAPTYRGVDRRNPNRAVCVVCGND